MMVQAGTADWFSHGQWIPNVEQRSPDAEFIIDSEFFEDVQVAADDLVWRECDVPIEAFGLVGTDLATHLGQLKGVDAAHEAARADLIRAWMVEEGVVHALNCSPILVTFSGGGVKIEDGYHRLGLAVFEFGQTTVKALCADLDAARQGQVDQNARQTPSVNG